MKKYKVGIIWILTTIMMIGIISGIWIHFDGSNEENKKAISTVEAIKQQSSNVPDHVEKKEEIRKEEATPSPDATAESSEQPATEITKEPQKTAETNKSDKTDKVGTSTAKPTAKPTVKPSVNQSGQGATSKPGSPQQTDDSVINTPVVTPNITPGVTMPPAPSKEPEVTPTKQPEVTPTKEPVATPIGTITLSVDANVIGCGMLISGISVELYQGESASHAVARGLKMAGYSYSNTGSLDKSFYLARISKAGMINNPSLSDYIKNILEDNGVKANMNKFSKDSLGEFDFTKYSGWRYSVNGTYAGVGMSDYSIKAGDRILLKYTLCLGKDA